MYCDEKEPQEPPEHTSEHAKSQNFLGACPQTPHFMGPHFSYLPWAPQILSAALCAGNEIFSPAQLHRAKTHAHTTPWLQQLAISPIPRHKMISLKSYIIQRTISFPSTHLGKKSSVPCLPICLV